jgi:NAD(P)H-hydrate epimerase
MAGMAALRAGAGLVTVASAESALPVIASHAPELMTEPLPENEAGAISLRAIESGRLAALVTGKAVVALGPGLGKHPETVGVVRRMVAELQVPLIVDADGLNALAGTPFQGKTLILTPHPGEMARLTGHSVAEVQADRVGEARAFAQQRQATVVLKGQRTVTAFSDATVFINSTGTPAMATGGTGDILTGLIAGLLAQFPHSRRDAVSAAVWLHGRAGEIGAAELGEKSLVATDLLRFLPEAIHELTSLSHRI